MSTLRRQYRTVTELPAWGTSTAPPREFLLFPFGATTATKMGGYRETVYLTAANAQAICDEWARRNIRGAFDNNHDFGDAGGWYDIETRADGLWVVDIDWTPETLIKFAGKKIRYYSPAFDVSKDAEGRLLIVALYNVALTNYPATDNQRPLIALTAHRRHNKMTPDEALKQAATIIEACEGKPELADKVALLLMGGSSEEAPKEEAPSEEMPLAATPEAEQIAQVALSITGTRTAREAVASLRALSKVVAERDAAQDELTQLRHTTFVNECLGKHLITPEQVSAALKEEPSAFRASMKWARPVIDNTSLSAKTAEKKEVKASDLINDDMRAYCLKTNADVNLFAEQWLSRYKGIPFASK